MNNVYFHRGLVTREDRHRLNGHGSGVLWFTGLSAAGKSTIAHGLEKELHDLGIRSYTLDGDNVRHGLNADLGFSREDRRENLRRIVEVSKLFTDAGIIVICAFITPFEEDRRFIRQRFEGGNYLEVYVKCRIETCEQRDPKGLYRKAREGLIKEYTGISSPFDEPEGAHVTLDTETLSAPDCVGRLLGVLKSADFWRPAAAAR